MKVIDLLNIIARGEEPPKKIMYDGKELIYSNYRYRTETGLIGFLDTKNMFYPDNLSIEIEIIEEDKEIEEISLCCLDKFKAMSPEERYHITAIEYGKLNELIREFNKLKKEGK